MWRFVHTGDLSPADNMAIDEAMLTVHQAGLTPPTVRFYGWKPASLSIGYFQQADAEVDLAALRTLGIGFVRRATGGRAVLHDRELTYSIVVSEAYPGMPASVAEACRMLSAGLLRGFRHLGLDARMADTSAHPAGGQRNSDLQSPACFDASSRHELVVEGKKIAGSAQMRAKGVILQHGSILLDLDADLLFRLLRFPNDEMKRRAQRIFERKAVAINDCMRSLHKPPVSLAAVEQAFLTGFAEEFGAGKTYGELIPEELALARKLAHAKYASDDWNRRR